MNLVCYIHIVHYIDGLLQFQIAVRISKSSSTSINQVIHFDLSKTMSLQKFQCNFSLYHFFHFLHFHRLLKLLFHTHCHINYLNGLLVPVWWLLQILPYNTILYICLCSQNIFINFTSKRAWFCNAKQSFAWNTNNTAEGGGKFVHYQLLRVVMRIPAVVSIHFIVFSDLSPMPPPNIFPLPL